MAIGIDVSIYAKTELLLSPLGARIVAYRGMCSEDASELQSPHGARIVAIPFTILDITGQELQSPQGARIVAEACSNRRSKSSYSPRKGREL